MNKIFCIVLFTLVVGVSFSQNSLKIGYLNTTKLLSKEQVIYENRVLQFSSMYDKALKDYQNLTSNLVQNHKNYTSEELTKKSLELDKNQNYVKELKSALDVSLKQLKDSLFNSAREKISYFVTEIGSANNYDIIVDKSSAIIFCNVLLCDNLDENYLLQKTITKTNHDPSVSTKIGYLDFQKLISQTDEFVKYKQKLNDFENKYGSIKQQFQQKLDNFNPNNYTADELTVINRQLSDEKLNLEESYHNELKVLETEQKTMMAIVEENLFNQITEFAQENNFALIFDIKLVVYANKNCQDVYELIVDPDKIIEDGVALNINFLDSKEYVESQNLFVVTYNKLLQEIDNRLAEMGKVNIKYQEALDNGNNSEIGLYRSEIIRLDEENKNISQQAEQELISKITASCKAKITEMAPKNNVDIIIDNFDGSILYYNPKKISRFPIYRVDE
jgi:Skp family chaperone for outer membrane proteins